MQKDKISAAKFLHGTQQEKMEFVTAFTEALKKNGWAVLTDLGLESKEVDEMFQWNKRLFDTPKDWTMKNKVNGTNGLTPDRATGPASRGYGAVNSEKIWKLKSENSFKESQRQDLKEFFDMGPPDDTEYPTAFPPESVLPGFSDFMKVKYYRLQEVATQLMGALEIGLGLPPNALTQKCEPVNSELRFNHYPPLQATSRQGGLRSVGHTDLGVLTLLFADGVAGLEFENRATGAFEMVETRGSQEMLVNVSDTLERWTNGVLRGGLHRVSGAGVGDQSVMPTRRSIVFFYKADMQSGSGPLEEFVSEKNPARYDDVNVDEFLRRMNARLYK